MLIYICRKSVSLSEEERGGSLPRGWDGPKKE